MGKLENVVCLLDTDSISIIFETPSDAEASSRDVGYVYELGVGYRVGSDDFRSYDRFFPLPLPAAATSGSGVNTRLYHRVDRLDLGSAGRRVLYLTVRVTNKAGLHSIVTSGPVYVKSDLTMEQNWINDGINSGSDMEYQMSTVEIGASFSFGVNCPIRRGHWAVESVDGNLTQPYIELEPNRFQISPGTTYIRSVLIKCSCIMRRHIVS